MSFLRENTPYRSLCVSMDNSEPIELGLGTTTAHEQAKKAAATMPMMAVMIQEGPWRWRVEKETLRERRWTGKGSIYSGEMDNGY